MCANGEQPDTPARWRLELTWKPTRPGIEGFHELADPIFAYLRWLDRGGDRHIVWRPVRIDRWPDLPSDDLPPEGP